MDTDITTAVVALLDCEVGAEEESKRKQEEKSIVAKKRKQKRKAKKKGSPAQAADHEDFELHEEAPHTQQVAEVEAGSSKAQGCVRGLPPNSRVVNTNTRTEISASVLDKLHGGIDYKHSACPALTIACLQEGFTCPALESVCTDVGCDWRILLQ